MSGFAESLINEHKNATFKYKGCNFLIRSPNLEFLYVFLFFLLFLMPLTFGT